MSISELLAIAAERSEYLGTGRGAGDQQAIERVWEDLKDLPDVEYGEKWVGLTAALSARTLTPMSELFELVEQFLTEHGE